MAWTRKFSVIVVALLGLAMAPATPAAAAPAQPNGPWQRVSGTPAKTNRGHPADIAAARFAAYTLDRAAMKALLGTAPKENVRARTLAAPLTLTLPTPSGGTERFAVEESPVMEAGLAARHPEIKTYAGRGLDDPTATIRADITALGFHASVRSERGAWYVDPYYHQDQSLYAAYYGRDLSTEDGQFVERDDVEAAAQDLAGELADVPPGPVVTLRTYRLALVTDPSYATFFGADNVTAAKVTLINRVTQIYEDETAIRLVLINDTDKTNLNTAALATEPNGPCGAAACFTTAQLAGCAGGTLNRNRIVLGQLVGASAYDIGHLGLGVNGGGVAGLGVVGGDGKARGCTGLPTPVGDFYAVDYVAHEMGHQFGGNHTFNGTQLNCSGGNRSAANSVEPGSGSSIMAYAGICRQDDLQPHSDPYWSQRSFTEITTYTGSTRPAINEVQTVSLRDFDTDGDSFTLAYNGMESSPITRGLNFTTAGIKSALDALVGAPVTVAAFGGAGALNDTGFQVTFNGAPLAATNVAELAVTNAVGATGFVGETAKGGPIGNGGNQVEVTTNHAPVVTVPAAVTIPVRTPFALTGSATDSDGETVTYMWEQNDRGAAAGTALVSNVKANGPLFRQFGTAAIVSPTDTVKYHSPGENAVSTDPTRVFPDMAQVAAGTTNAKTGTCPDAPPSPTPVPADLVACYSEFLPTADWIGLAGDRVMHLRLTARDGHPGAGGVGNAEVALTLAPTAGPFLVTSQGSATTYEGGTPQLVSWDVAGTDAAPVNAADVRITMSADGGATFPYTLAASTPNDGSEAVTVPNVPTQHARIRIEAVGNVFFDLNDADFAIQAAPEVTTSGDAVVQYSDAVSSTISATDADSAGSSLSASASGLPAGLSLAAGSTSDHGATWTVVGNTTAAPGSYPVTVVVSDELSISRSTAFVITVSTEDAEAAYTGDMLTFTGAVNLRATVSEAADPTPGDVTTATVAFREGSTTLCTAPVGLVGSATTVGSANCGVTLPVGSHTITAVVGGYYSGETSALVEVAKPDGSFVTGGGLLTPTRSAGAYPADAGSQTLFAFNAKLLSKGVTGHVEVVYESGGHAYAIHSTALNSLGVTSGHADLRGTAMLVDITDPLQPVVIGSGYTLALTATDRGRTDSLGITVWNGNALVFSSDWAGNRTQELNLAGGSLVIH